LTSNLPTAPWGFEENHLLYEFPKTMTKPVIFSEKEQVIFFQRFT